MVDIKEELSESGNKTGIEAEVSDDDIFEPFNPESISIDQKTVPMDTLIRRLKQGSIQLAPDFQRNEVWDETKRSQLIESLMLKIPLPMFYVAASENGDWEVVDGLQRLSAIRDFILGSEDGKLLTLKNLEFLGEKFDNKNYKAIENKADKDDVFMRRLLNTIMETEMRFTVINPGTSEDVKRNIFKRINTGGMPLTAQEIRHALYQGKASKLLEELVKSEEFSTAINNSLNDTRMAARELILRFLSFSLFVRESYKSNQDKWLSNAMRVINKIPDLDDASLQKIFKNQDIPKIKCHSISELKERFYCAMQRGGELFTDHAFRKSLPGDTKKSPINKALFEVWSNILCGLTNDQFKSLVSNKVKVIEEYKVLMKDNEFLDSISRHASQALRGVEFRYDKVSKLVNNLLEVI